MSDAPLAPDSSVLIAGYDLDHAFHAEAERALAAVRRSGVLIAHTMAESFAVLTGGPYVANPDVVLTYLGQFQAEPVAGIRPDEYPSRLRELAAAGIGGGALYDGLIALGARGAGATLASLDHRAAPTYERCGVEFRLLDASGG